MQWPSCSHLFNLSFLRALYAVHGERSVVCSHGGTEIKVLPSPGRNCKRADPGCIMLRFHFAFIGKTQFSDLDSAIQRYLNRLAHYASVRVHQVKAERITTGASEDVVRKREGERILRLIPKQSTLVVWHEKGRQLDSIQVADFVDQLVRDGHLDIWMVLGGPLGVSSQILTEATYVLSLSKMTFPHDVARLLVAEQLYRAFSILKGEPYHK